METIELKQGDGSVARRKQATSPTGESKYFYIRYYVNGRQINENSKMTEWKDAYDLLVKRKAEIARGEQPVYKKSLLRYEDLREILLQEYRSKKRNMWVRKDGVELFPGRPRLDKFFKGMLVSLITSDKIREYIIWCQKQDIADSSIRRELVCLRAAFGIALKEGRILHVPYFPMPKDSEPAGRYIPPDTFENLLKNMPQKFHPFFTFLYHSGCRVGAARKITWEMINKDATEIKLPGSIMKARQPLTIVLAGEGLEPVSSDLKKMFRKENEPVFYTANYRRYWREACHELKLGVYDPQTRHFDGLRIHDMRCSAAVNLIDAGVPEDIVMKIGGWKTKSMFSRYNVTNSERIKKYMILGGAYVKRMQKA